MKRTYHLFEQTSHVHTGPPIDVSLRKAVSRVAILQGGTGFLELQLISMPRISVFPEKMASSGGGLQNDIPLVLPPLRKLCPLQDLPQIPRNFSP